MAWRVRVTISLEIPHSEFSDVSLLLVIEVRRIMHVLVELLPLWIRKIIYCVSRENIGIMCLCGLDFHALTAG